jgi:hypothetical protein
MISIFLIYQIARIYKYMYIYIHNIYTIYKKIEKLIV